MADYNYHRVASTLIGLTCVGLGCYGAFEFAHKLQGTITYLVLAAPVVALTAALIPLIAEATWRSGAYVKALLWWGALVPAAAVVFYSACERVHTAKAGGEAERAALRSATARADDALTAAKAEYAMAQAEADKVRGWHQCGPKCLGIKATAEAKRELIAEAEAVLLKAESKAVVEASLRAPVWLLPAALDVVAFMAIWTALSGPRASNRPTSRRPPRRKKLVRRTKGFGLSAATKRHANDNIVQLPAA